MNRTDYKGNLPRIRGPGLDPQPCAEKPREVPSGPLQMLIQLLDSRASSGTLTPPAGILQDGATRIITQHARK